MIASARLGKTKRRETFARAKGIYWTDLIWMYLGRFFDSGAWVRCCCPSWFVTGSKKSEL